MKKKSLLSRTKNIGTKVPFFMMHGMDGGIAGHKSIARYLEKERPIYDFRSYLCENKGNDFISIELMAKNYVEEVMQEQPEGPYLLGGHSIGAFIAYEAAILLQEKGMRVGMLFLLDMVPNKYFKSQLEDLLIMKTIGKYLNINILPIYAELRNIRTEKEISEDFSGLSDELRIEMLQKCIEHAGVEELARVILKSEKTKYLEHCYNVFKTNLVATINYNQSSEYAGKSLIFYTDQYRQMRENIPDLGWGKYIKGDMAIEQVPGDHFSMLKEPHVRILVEKINLYLNVIC